MSRSGAAPDAIPVFTTDAIAALYTPLRSDGWALRRGGTVLTRGYWGSPQLVTDIVVLTRGDQTWMSITPLEIESQMIGVCGAIGHVVIFGLGLGWSAAASALKPEVERVTVVERDPAVIALHEALGLFGRLPDGAGDKVRIVSGDAHDWRPEASVDTLMPDIWFPLVSDGRVAEVQGMQRAVAAGAIYFWGQEMEIARHARAAGRSLDDEGIAETVADFALPLIGPGTPGYAERVRAAAEAWLGGHWLPAQVAA